MGAVALLVDQRDMIGFGESLDQLGEHLLRDLGWIETVVSGGKHTELEIVT